MPKSKRSGGSIEPNAFAFGVLTGASTLVGLTPYILFQGARWALPVVAIVGSAIGFVRARRAHAKASQAPSPGEWLTAFWGQTGLHANVSMVALGIQALVYWSTRLLFWGLALADVVIDRSIASKIALAFSALTAALVYIGMLQDEDSTFLRLYPRAAGVRSVYHAVWQKYSTWIVLGVLVGLAAATAVVALDLTAWYWIAALLGYLFYTGFPLAQLGEKPRRARQRGVAAVKRMLAVSGWELHPVVETGDPEIDPLLGDVDLLARRGNEAIAVEVQAVDVDWTVASGLRMAGRVLEDVIAEEVGAPVQLNPVLVVAGAELSESLRSFARLEQFHVVQIPESTLKQMLDTDDDDELRDLTRQVEFLPEGANG